MQKNKSKYSELINEISKNIIRKDKITPEEMLYSTIQGWRNYLTLDEAIQVLTNLPPFLKEVFILNWKPSHNPVMRITESSFLENTVSVFNKNFNKNIPEEEIELIICTIFKLLEKHIDTPKMMSIKSYIPNTCINLSLYTVEKAA